jgi:Holliday junction DNA helicase RuvA
VKGIGPKSAYALVSNIGVNEIIQAINLEAKTTLTKVPGLGTKGAAQIILDLSGKINKVKMYTDVRKISISSTQSVISEFKLSDECETKVISEASHHDILNDTLMACKELGFKEDKIISLAQRILGANQISKAEQLIHLVLKEI